MARLTAAARRAIAEAVNAAQRPHAFPDFGVRREIDKLGFFSPALEAAKMLPARRIGVNEAIGRIERGRGLEGEFVGSIKDEVRALGLRETFAGKKTVAPDELVETIRKQRLQLNEAFNRFDPREERPSTFKASVRVPKGLFGGGALFGHNIRSPAFATREEAEAWTRDYLQEYRRDYPITGRRARATGIEEDRPNGWDAARLAGVRRGPGDLRLPGNDPVFEMRLKIPPGVKGSLEPSHWSSPPSNDHGVVASVRGEERLDDQGQRTLFGGEFQSDVASRRRHATAGALRARPHLTKADLDKVYGVPLTENTSQWVNAAARRLLARAVDGGFDSISAPTRRTATRIQGHSKLKNSTEIYDTNVLASLEQLAKAYGASVRRGGVMAPGRYGSSANQQAAPAYVLAITPEMRRTILERGLPLYAGAGVGMLGALRAALSEEEQSDG